MSVSASKMPVPITAPRTSDNPEINVQLPGFHVDSDNVGSRELKVFVRVWRLNAVSVRIAEHAVTCHLDIEDMRLAIPVFFRQDPLDTLPASSETL